MNEAIWAIIGVVIGALMSAGADWLMQSRQFKQEMQMYSLANQSKDAVKSVLLEMLNHKAYTDRSFPTLREGAEGFTDDELRQILHELGARKTSRDNDSEEWWFLESRRQERHEKKSKHNESI